MRVRLREIVEGGLDIVDQAAPKDLDLKEEFINLEKPIIVKGHLERVSDFVLAKLTVTYTLDTVCARCLDPIDGDVSFDFEADLPFKMGDKHVDLGARVREEILTGYVPRVLCKEDCQGICQGCGVYLNTEKCECNNKKKEVANF
ncbi:MAG: DUF177 domain-containing protein [Candidatus Omnitrophica bacterium]|nr:DUF177 domain-containing protein [Candidatus Omnitrophota bacterium]